MFNLKFFISSKYQRLLSFYVHHLLLLAILNCWQKFFWLAKTQEKKLIFLNTLLPYWLIKNFWFGKLSYLDLHSSKEHLICYFISMTLYCVYINFLRTYLKVISLNTWIQGLRTKFLRSLNKIFLNEVVSLNVWKKIIYICSVSLEMFTLFSLSVYWLAISERWAINRISQIFKFYTFYFGNLDKKIFSLLSTVRFLIQNFLMNKELFR